MDENIEFVDFPYENITYRTTVTRKYSARKPFSPHDPNKVTAFIPGTIIKVMVREGAKVKKGDGLLILQAMKMNNQLLATHNAVVKKINVKAGDVVAKNTILLELR